MEHFRELFHTRRARTAVAAVLLAGLATAAYVGVAFASTFTLQVAKKAKVTNQSGRTKSEGIVVTRGARAVYTLGGDSKTHPECTKANGCFTFWPPVTVSSPKQLNKAPGVPGKPGVWRRNGFLQVTLNGHPLYRFAPDSQRDRATGEGIVSFGGTWHVVKDRISGSGTGTPTPTSTTPSCLYPPCS